MGAGLKRAFKAARMTRQPKVKAAPICAEQKALEKKLKALGKISDDQKKSVACSLIGHSRIQTHCFGYYYCGRCGEQVGDSLASIYNGASKAVIVGHKCPTCESNYAECTWKDKFLAPDPFAKEESEP